MMLVTAPVIRKSIRFITEGQFCVMSALVEGSQWSMLFCSFSYNPHLHQAFFCILLKTAENSGDASATDFPSAVTYRHAA